MTNADLVGGPAPASAVEPLDPNQSPSPGADEGVMTLVDHLAELRNRLIKSIVAVAVGSVIGWIATPELMKVLRAPIGARELIFLSPGEAFFVYIKIAIAVGIIIAMPV
ncbi:MAG TPA: twin-arginine translocase subunit TatC, partial [Candidatus Limnocylindrales bacterium]